MSQDNIIRMVSVGDEAGRGKGHMRYIRKNKKKHANTKFQFSFFNKLAGTHTIYKEKK